MDFRDHASGLILGSPAGMVFGEQKKGFGALSELWEGKRLSIKYACLSLIDLKGSILRIILKSGPEGFAPGAPIVMPFPANDHV